MTTDDVTQDVVQHLGPPATSTGLFKNTSHKYDFAIAGLPFLSAANKQNPYHRGFAKTKREQVDTTPAPGEQSMDLWWLRSQVTFSGGAGQTLYEPANDQIIRTRFSSSQGIDPWTDGQFSLLHKVNKVEDTVGAAFLASATTGGKDYLVFADASTLNIYDGTATGQAQYSDLSGSVATGLISTGTTVLVCTDAGIDSLDVTDNSTVALWTAAPGSVAGGWWVKQRIIATVGHSLYELALAGGAWPAALYTHPDTSWTWTSVAEAPNAILAAGYSGTKGAIYRFEISSTGTLPTLTSAITTAELPFGEYPTGILNYLGSFLAIGTNKGVRIAQISDQGLIQYGPLTVESTTPVVHLTARDRFIFAGITAGQADGTSGAVRIDLSAPDQAGRFGYAWDLSTTDTGAVTGVTEYGTTGRLAIASTDVWLEDSTNLVSSGWLETGYVLYGTLEKKTFRLATIKATVATGTGLTVSSVQPDGDATSIMTYGSDPSSELLIQPTAAIDRMALKFTLTSNGTTTGPVVSGWSMKALPATTAKELIEVPLLCYDFEMDNHGVKRGKKGSAVKRYQQLRDALMDAPVVTFQDLHSGEALVGTVTGDSLTYLGNAFEFLQTSPPTNATGFGGVIKVTLRVL